MTNQQLHTHRPAPSPEGAYADDMTIQSYRSIISHLEEQRTKLQLNSMQGQDSSRIYAMRHIDYMIHYMQTILRNECKHEYVENDYIDTGVESGQLITYCERCYSTFN